MTLKEKNQKHLGKEAYSENGVEVDQQEEDLRRLEQKASKRLSRDQR